jgi:hypothetical protein
MLLNHFTIQERIFIQETDNYIMKELNKSTPFEFLDNIYQINAQI